MSETNDYLEQARLAIEEDRKEDAKEFYEMAFDQMPDNLEAKFYCDFYSQDYDFEGARSFLTKTSGNYMEQVVDFVIRDESLPFNERLNILSSIIGTYLSAFEYVMSIRWLPLYRSQAQRLGQYIDDAGLHIIAKCIWEEMIKTRYGFSEYRSCWDKGKTLWFEDLAKKIQTIDPSYVAPEFKQAGCLRALTNNDIGRLVRGE